MWTAFDWLRFGPVGTGAVDVVAIKCHGESYIVNIDFEVAAKV
jgi:hypothetical protein